MGVFAKMMCEKAARVLFGRLCPRCDLSVVYWDRTDCAIVGPECQMLSASCSTKSTKQFGGHSLEYAQRDPKRHLLAGPCLYNCGT